MNFAFQLAVYSYSAIEINDAFEFNSFSKKGEVVVV